MHTFEFCLTDGMQKVLPKRAPLPFSPATLYALCGETVSFQLAYRCENDTYDGDPCRFFPATESRLPTRIRQVGLVPVAYPCHGVYDDDYLVTDPGLLPDLLLPRTEEDPVQAVAGQWRSLWIDVEIAEVAEPGDYLVTMTATAPDGSLLYTADVTVRVSHAALLPQTLIHTEWFHTDCLADYYHVPVWSEEHWRIIDKFMASAARHGVNLLLTPVFTPPLDTAKGGARTTVQLADVTVVSEGVYTFDFTKLDRWIELCRKNGIFRLEIAHLFAQWGAAYAPRIVATVDGQTRSIFGWYTPAAGEDYQIFLAQFLPALKSCLASHDMLESAIFHISDEPEEAELMGYAAAKASVLPLLSGCRIMDALSSFRFYQEGVVEKPVVAVDQIAPFLESEVKGLWAYYCTAQAVDVPNRFIAMPSSRNRILGTLLYRHNIEGFLHWGFNFYNAKYSLFHIDPFRTTDACEAFPSGDPFLVYPGEDGEPLESIRGQVLKMALFDQRALATVEAALGRAAAETILMECTDCALSFTDYPRDAAFFQRLRRRIFEALEIN